MMGVRPAPRKASMGTMGDAYREAVRLDAEVGDEAGYLAFERAEECELRGDKSGFKYWIRVHEFIHYMHSMPNTSVH